MSGTAIAIQALLADADVAGLVGARVYPTMVPSTATLPCVVVRLVAETDAELLAGAGRWPESRVQVESLASTATGADVLGEAIVAALGDLTHRSVGARVVTAWRAGSDFADHAADRSVFRRVTDYMLRWR